MSDGRDHIPGIELPLMPSCQGSKGRVFSRAVEVGMERARRGVTPAR